MTNSVFQLLERLIEGQVADGASQSNVPLRNFIELPASTKVLILVSGGLDSAVALHLALYLKLDVTAIQFEHSKRPQAEALCAARLISDCNVPSFVITYPQVHLADSDAITMSLAESNAIYYSLAGSLAAVLNTAYIVGGTILPDWKTEENQNAIPENFSLLNQLLAREYSGYSPRIITPLIYSSKSDIIRLARALQLPLANTWSCVDDGPSPCGSCPQCKTRADDLQAADYLEGGFSLC